MYVHWSCPVPCSSIPSQVERERDTSQQRQVAPGAKSAHIIPLRHLAGALLLIISALVYIWGGFNKFRINPSQWQLMAVTISLNC